MERSDPSPSGAALRVKKWNNGVFPFIPYEFIKSAARGNLNSPKPYLETDERRVRLEPDPTDRCKHSVAITNMGIEMLARALPHSSAG
jgi:hypothetical protein